MREFKIKKESKKGNIKTVCTLKVKNNIIYNIGFTTKDKEAKEGVIKLLKNKVIPDAEAVETKDKKLKPLLTLAKATIKEYRKKHKDPLQEILDTIKDYDKGFPQRNPTDEYAD